MRIGLMTAALALVGCTTMGNELPTAQADLDPQRVAELETAIGNGAAPNTTSVLILQGGRIAYERYFGDGGPDKLNDTRSATKTLVALAVGQAITDGKLKSVDARVFDFFPDMAPYANDNPLKRQITVRDLLTMTSALDCDDNNDTPGNEENMYPQESWTRFALDLPLMAGWTREADGLGPWRYCTAGSFLLGQVVARATGAPVDLYIAQRILKPLGIERAQWDRSPSGEAQTGGGLELTAGDLAKIILMLKDRGKWRERRVIAASWIDEMTTIRRPAFAGMSYGYQMWERRYASTCGEVEAWFMAGNGGNHAVSLPALDAAIVITRTAYNTRNMHQQTMTLIEERILPALGCSGPRFER